MKRHIQEPGIRKWSGTDLVELQSEPFKALDGFFGNFGPMVLSGCNVSGNTIAPGLVILPETADGKTTYRIATFAGLADAQFPVYLTLLKTPLTREYVNATDKVIAYEYTAVVGDTARKNLTIEVTGGITFMEALQDSKHRFVTDEDKVNWNNKKSEDCSPFAIFDGIGTTGRVLTGKAPSDYYGTIVYLESQKTFLKRIPPLPGRVGMIVYYTDWEGREKYTEEYLPELSGSAGPGTIPYMNKLYLCDGIMYYWTGDVLEKVGGSDKENYSMLINKPCINGVELQGDVSLQALGLVETTCPFTEIVEDDVTIEQMSFGSASGDIVFVTPKNTFALRVNPVPKPGIASQAKFYNNWIGAQDFVEFYTPPLGDGAAYPRPPLGRIYSIGQVRYYWDGTGLKVYGYNGGNGQTGISPMVEFDGVIENVQVQMASVTGSGRVFFAKNSRFGQGGSGENLNIFVINIGNIYYSNWIGREKYSDDTLTPYSGKLYRCGGSLHLWDGATLNDVAVANTVSMSFGTLLKQAHSTDTQVKGVIGNDFDRLYKAVRNNASLRDITQSESEPAQITARCKTANGSRQVTIYFPFEYYQAATMSTLTISEDFTANAQHFKMAAES